MLLGTQTQFSNGDDLSLAEAVPIDFTGIHVVPDDRTTTATSFPAVVSSPRSAPLPPISPTSGRPISPNQRIASLPASSVEDVSDGHNVDQYGESQWGQRSPLGMDCTTDLAVPERLSKRAKQRCVRDYRPCHCWYFLITL